MAYEKRQTEGEGAEPAHHGAPTCSHDGLLDS
jgi:hypothetical protein